MKVKELIEKLKSCNPEGEVLVPTQWPQEWGYIIKVKPSYGDTLLTIAYAWGER